MSTPSDALSLVVREVERLIAAPYAPSFQDLNALFQQVDPGSICSWALHKPCQVGPLVDVLVDGLSRSRFAVLSLTGFAKAPEFRNNLLKRYPYIIDQFLTKSVENDESEYLSVCVAALSSPLPDDFIVPASLASFIMKLIESMRANPCTETIYRLYLVSGCLQASPRILSEIPSHIMSSFQTELTKTLRNLDDHMGNLLCLATFARIASSQYVDPGSDNQGDGPGWLHNIKHFFGTKRGSKTLDLVVLRVILACSSNCSNLTTEQSAESIRLAIEICDSVGPGQKESWMVGNPAKIAKLYEKIKREGIDNRVQLLGVMFLVSLGPEKGSSQGLIGPALEFLLSGNTKIDLSSFPFHLTPHLVGANLVYATQFTVCMVLDYVLSALCTEPSDTISMFKLQMAKALLLGVRSSSGLVNMIEDKYKDAIETLLESFPRHPTSLRCDNSATCGVSLSKLQNDLFYDLLALYLDFSFRNMGQESPRPPHVSTLISFITRNKQLLPEFKCKFLETRPLDLRTPLSNIKLHDSPAPLRQDWRAGMVETLMENARMFNDSMMQKVESVCYDLERRCENIEAPLKATEEERNRITLEAEQLKQQNDGLEVRLQQTSCIIADLKEEMARLEGHADSAALRVEELSDTLEQTRQELENLRHRSQETISGERESARTRELDLIASMTEKDDCLEEMREDRKTQNDENNHLRALLESVSKERDSSAETVASLKQEALSIQVDLEKTTILLAQKDEKIGQLISENKNADNNAHELQRKLTEKILETESLKFALDDFKGELDKLKTHSEKQYSDLTRECTKKQEDNLSLRHAMQEAASNATKQVQTREKRIRHLEKKVQHLREERATKAREFSEAQQHISRLMGVMGFTPGPSKSRFSSKQLPQSTAEPLQSTSTSRQTNLRDADSQVPDEALTVSSESNLSHPGGRSPKRSRNSAFSAAELTSCHRNSETNTRTSMIPAGQNSVKSQKERQPLRDISQNSQPNSQLSDVPPSSQGEIFLESQVFKHISGNRREEIGLDMDLEFSKDFILTSTALSDSCEEISD